MEVFQIDSKSHFDVLNNKMTHEIKKASAMLKGSILDDQSGVTNQVGDGVQKLINRKVDKTDLADIIKSKTNKSDTQMIINQFDTMHKQLEAISQIIQQIMRTKVEPSGPDSANKVKT